jgi:UDP-N-acetylglucosamine 2-epimerase (non-hydrolysing)
MKTAIHLIAAARPNFMKIAPLYHALKRTDWAEPLIVHTGQHYDLNMSEAFFRDLMLPAPDFHLGIGSGSHAEQTAGVLVAYEKLLRETRPAMVVVVGDVNSTMACTLAAVKMDYHAAASQSGKHAATGAPRPVVAHLEAGLRSFDRSMPEEINRLVTDALADILWTPSPDGDENLLREGVAAAKIERVGNIMIDSLEMMRARIEAQNAAADYGLTPGAFGLVTLHRPSNVDAAEKLRQLCEALVRTAARIPLIFPVHPRTRKNLAAQGLLGTLERSEGLQLEAPIGYLRFMNLVFNCRLVVTDSGGIQEETSYLGIPCLTLRANTERPVTITEGTNCLCTLEALETRILELLQRPAAPPPRIALWDGNTASRVVESIRRRLGAGAKGIGHGAKG